MAKLKIFLSCERSEIFELIKAQLVLTDLEHQFVGDPHSADYCIVDETIFKKEMMAASLSSKSVVISHADINENIQMLANTELNHIVGFNSKNIVKEISDTISGLEGKGIWGLERSLTQNPEIHSHGVNDSREINKVIEETIDKFNYENFFNSPKDSIRLIANELLTNALYNASITKSKLYPHMPVDRKSTVSIKASEHILFKMGVCENTIALSVQDSFGSLTRNDVVENLLRSSKEKKVKDGQSHQGGAGLGLFLIYNYANQLIVNIRHGVRTEVICIIDGNKRYKKYKERITSFHLFEEV